MKKIILVILSVLCLVSYGQLEKKTEKKNDLTEENLKGKVKSIKETLYEAVDKFGQIKKGNVLNNYFTIYNKKGNTIEGNEYYSNRRFNYKTTYKYDEKGNNIEENYYNSNGRLYEKHTYKYEYDKNNNWTQRIEYKNTIPHRITEKIIEYYP